MEAELSAFVFGTYPGMKIPEPNVDGHILNFGDINDFVTHLSCSDDSMILIRNSGKSESIGNNNNGKLGLGHDKNILEFNLINIDIPFKKSQIGNDFCIWLTKNNDIYTSGINSMIPIKLENYKGIDISCFDNTLIILKDENHLIFWSNFLNFENFYEFEFNKIISISSGNQFITILLENGTLLKIDKDGNLIPLITGQTSLNGGNRFISQSSSSNYTAAVDINKGVWIFGQMGKFNGDNAIIPIMEEAFKVVALPNHCIVFEDIGTCFSFGSNSHGQLGNGVSIDCFSPMPMNQKSAAFEVSGGKKYTILLPFGFNEDIAKYFDDNVIPGSLAKSLQELNNFLLN